MLILVNMHMARDENEVVKPMKPTLYKRFVDDICSRRNKLQQHALFEVLNNFHLKLKLTVEVNPENVLDKKKI